MPTLNKFRHSGVACFFKETLLNNNAYTQPHLFNERKAIVCRLTLYTLFCSSTLSIHNSWMFSATNSSI